MCAIYSNLIQFAAVVEFHPTFRLLIYIFYKLGNFPEMFLRILRLILNISQSFFLG